MDSSTFCWTLKTNTTQPWNKGKAFSKFQIELWRQFWKCTHVIFSMSKFLKITFFKVFELDLEKDKTRNDIFEKMNKISSSFLLPPFREALFSIWLWCCCCCDDHLSFSLFYFCAILSSFSCCYESRSKSWEEAASAALERSHRSSSFFFCVHSSGS